jgi:GTPase
MSQSIHDNLEQQITSSEIQALPNPFITEIRIGIMGNVDSGKSTLTGVLTKDVLDDGRGRARALVMKHKHERATGRTSCVTHHYTRTRQMSNQDSSAQINTENGNQQERHITYIDLAGHEKYLKTTINGIHRCYIDYAIIVIGANMGMESGTFAITSKTQGYKNRGDTMYKQINMTEEHLNLCLNLAIPTIIVMTKTDLAPVAVREKTLAQINTYMAKKTRGSRLAIEIKTLDDLDKFMSEYYYSEPVRNMLTGVPVIPISSVSGLGLDILKSCISRLPQYTDYAPAAAEPANFVIDGTYHIDGIGLVVSGTQREGVIHKGDIIQIGPIGRQFYPVVIKSIHNNFREFVDFLQPGHSGCFAIKAAPQSKFEIKRHMIRHGTRLMTAPRTCSQFKARIKVLHHPTMIKLNYEPTIHCGSITQAAQIIEMDKEHMRLGDIAEVRFRFKFRPEFIQQNAKLVFREGMTRGIGKVLTIDPI